MLKRCHTGHLTLAPDGVCATSGSNLLCTAQLAAASHWAACCFKCTSIHVPVHNTWYGYLKHWPPAGDWGEGDDGRMLVALCSAKSQHEADWEALVPGRDGDIARQRWDRLRKLYSHGGGFRVALSMVMGALKIRHKATTAEQQ